MAKTPLNDPMLDCEYKAQVPDLAHPGEEVVLYYRTEDDVPLRWKDKTKKLEKKGKKEPKKEKP